MRIALFDYQVIRSNPAGGCHRRLLAALAGEHEFTVFSVAFDNPDPARIRWVRIRVPLRPLALLFVSFHLMAPLAYAWARLRGLKPFDWVQGVESNTLAPDIAYVHFCHTHYLRKHGREILGFGHGMIPQGGFWRRLRAGLRAALRDALRNGLRWLDHALHAWLERRVFRRARYLVVPSEGLAREIAGVFPDVASKIEVIPNAVDSPGWVDSLDTVDNLDTVSRAGHSIARASNAGRLRQRTREGLGFSPQDTVFLFAALGHFERKGLPLLLEALEMPGGQPTALGRARLLVVGGTPDLVSKYQAQAVAFGVDKRVQFTGFASELRPYLAASDAFVLPSRYETFSLVAFEAAAAGLPLLVTRLHGVEELVAEGQAGWVLPRTVEAFREAMAQLVLLNPAERQRLGAQARRRAASYSPSVFAGRWRAFYERLAVHAAARRGEPLRGPAALSASE